MPLRAQYTPASRGPDSSIAEALQFGDGSMIQFNHNLNVLLHLGEHGTRIVNDFSFANVDSSDRFHYAASNPRMELSIQHPPAKCSGASETERENPSWKARRDRRLPVRLQCCV